MNSKEIKAARDAQTNNAPDYWDNSTPSKTWANRFGDVIKAMEYIESKGLNADYEFGHGYILISTEDNVYKYTQKASASGKHKWCVMGKGKEYSCNSIQDLVEKYILDKPWG